VALQNYGVFLGKVESFNAERDDDQSPHFQLFISGGGETVHCAVNVKSQLAPSELAFHINRRFEHPITADLADIGEGFTALPSAGKRGLDYIRSNLFVIENVEALPHDAPGQEDDLQDIFFNLCRTAQAAQAQVFVFGEPFSHGMHDIHMNQGNDGSFSSDNWVFQDGGILFHFPNTDQWTALFLAFQSQHIHTDDTNGNPLPGSATFSEVISGGDIEPVDHPVTPDVIEDEFALRIIAALVNPEGYENQPSHTGRPESVTLFNFSPEEIRLDGWFLEASGGSRSLNGLSIQAGACLNIELNGDPPLSNKGGILTLLNNQGLKVHGISYTKEQAQKEAWSIRF
jgi:uncharacterized protein YukJ